MLRLAVVLTVLGLLSCGPLAGLAGEIKTVAGQPEDKHLEAAVPEPDHETMHEIDRLLDQAMEEQGSVPAPPAALEQPQDNQGDKDVGQGK